MGRFLVLCLVVAVSVSEGYAASIRSKRQVIPREFQNINIENYLKVRRLFCWHVLFPWENAQAPRFFHEIFPCHIQNLSVSSLEHALTIETFSCRLVEGEDVDIKSQLLK